MDGQRFDEVTKAFAMGTSRRAVLRTALGGMSAVLLALVGGTNAGAAGKRGCVEGCKKQFGPGRARGRCISACAKSCGDTVCGSDEFCCNESCGICAPIGGSCTQEFCGKD